MGLFTLISFIGLIAFFSILLDRRWQQRALQRQQERVAAQVTPSPAANGQNTPLVEQIKAGWYKRMGWRSEPSTDRLKLRDWLITNLSAHPTTQQGIAQLTDAEFDALHQQLQTFCASLNIDLAWLGEQPLAKDLTLQTAVQAAVLHYVQAQQQAAAVQADLQAFKIYVALEQRPYSYEYQPLVQQLYTQVVNVGLTAPARPEALLATEKIRVEHMLRAIQHAADADRPAFYRALNALSNPLQQDKATAIPAAAPRNSHLSTATTS